MKKLSSFAMVGFVTLGLVSSTSAQKLDKETRHGQPSWVIQSDQVELAITEIGGHMAPVTFYRKDPSPVQPYHISPWQGESHDYPASASRCRSRMNSLNQEVSPRLQDHSDV